MLPNVMALNREMNGETVRDIGSCDDAIDVSEVYLLIKDLSASEKKRCALLETLKEQIDTGVIGPEKIVAHHMDFCIEQISACNENNGITDESVLALSLEFLYMFLLKEDGRFVSMDSKIHLLNNISNLLITIGGFSETRNRHLTKMCAVNSVLGHMEVIAPEETLQLLLDIEKFPECFLYTNVSKRTEMQHYYDCHCPDCRLKDKLHSAPNDDPMMLSSGQKGVEIFPVRALPHHYAAMCTFPNYWELLEARSKKIANDILDYGDARRGSRDRNWSKQIFCPGQQVGVSTDNIDWLSQEAATPTTPGLPKYVRGVIVSCSTLPTADPLVAMWLPDCALLALCRADNLHVLYEFSPVRAFAPMIFLAKAFGSPLPISVVTSAVKLLDLLLDKGVPRQSVVTMLEDNGLWKLVNLYKHVDVPEQIQLLQILNELGKYSDRINRLLVYSNLNNIVADKLLWKGYTQSVSSDEIEAIMVTLIQTMPRIEVRRWNKRHILLRVVHLFLKDSKPGSTMDLLTKCKDMLVWNPHECGGYQHYGPHNQQHRYSYGHGGHLPYNHNHHHQSRYHQRFQHRRSYSRDSVNTTKAEHRIEEENAGLESSYYTIGRKPRPGEPWMQCTSKLRNIEMPPLAGAVNGSSQSFTGMDSMIRGFLCLQAVQDLNTEILHISNLRDIRQVMLARIICGLLNSGGGKIYIGIGVSGYVSGINANRNDRDSFTQGILDITGQLIIPRMPPFTYDVEHRLVLQDVEHKPKGEWNLFVFIISIRPLKDVMYQVYPERIAYGRRAPEGTTICIKAEQKEERCYLPFP